MPACPPADLVSALRAFLSRSRVRRAYFAEDAATTPPQLAYLVHFPRLTVTLNGRDTMWIEHEGKARLIHPGVGEAVVLPANCWNRPLWTGSVVNLNLLFGKKQVGLSLVAHDARRRAPAAVCKAVLPAAWDDAPRNIMKAILGLHADPAGAAVPLIEALLRSCLGALTAPVVAPKRRAATLYDSICMYVQENFQSPLTRESIATHFRVSPNHVSRLFKREGMIAFNEYITYVRIDRAKYLLKHYRQSIDEVAVACGFSEASYFCRVFRRMTKMTPTEYRHQAAEPHGRTVRR
ncbi:MAG: helix-turn-helix transcriptional regulator [Opitutaceae bacterium]|jgi:AraC-like DNA-binding protein